MSSWAKKFDKCIDCGTKKGKHAGNGLCKKCYRPGKSVFAESKVLTHKTKGYKSVHGSKGIVYVFKIPNENNLYKIGATTRRIKNRMYSLNREKKWGLTVKDFICGMKSNCVWVAEKKIHAFFENKRLSPWSKNNARPEIFKLSQSDLTAFRKIEFINGERITTSMVSGLL